MTEEASSASLRGPSRRAVLVGCAAGAACVATGAGASERLVLVFDATRFKLTHPTRRSDFFRPEVFRGPRLSPGRASGGLALCDRFARREVALALVGASEVAALKADGRLALGFVA